MVRAQFSLLLSPTRPMTLDELKAEWQHRRDDFAQLRAQIDAATLFDHLLADLAPATAEHHTTLLTARRGKRASRPIRLTRPKFFSCPLRIEAGVSCSRVVRAAQPAT